jgi:PAS domain S-box-containing protein
MSHDDAMDDRGFRVLDAMPDAVLLIHPDGSVVYANPQATELFGYTRSFAGSTSEMRA